MAEVFATINHALSATTPDDPAAEIQPKHWNSGHVATFALALAVADVFGFFSNANGISFGTADSKITASYTVPTQSVQTQASGDIARSGFTSTSTAGVDIKATLNSGGLNFAVPAYLTTAQPVGAYLTTAALSQDSSKYAGTGFTSTTTAGTQIKATVGTNGVSMAVPAYLTAAEGAAGGAGTGATTATTAGTQIKATLGTDGLSLAFPAALTTAQPVGAYLTTARASNDAVGLNTALTANGVAWTVNSAGISLNVPAFLTTAALSQDSSKYAGTGVTTATTAGSELKATLAANGLNVGVPKWLTTADGGAGGGGATVSVVEIMDGARLTTAAAWNNATYSRRPIFIPFEIDNALTGCHTIRFLASRSSGTVLVATVFAGIYSRVDATSASLISSTSINYSLSTSALFSGVRMYDVTGLSALTLPPGRYLLGLAASVAAANSVPLHLMGGDAIPALAGFVNSGTNQSAATNSQSHVIPMWGVYSATSGGLPANVNASQISGGGSQNSPDVYAIIKAI